MLRQESQAVVADNSGVKRVLVIRNLGGTRKKYAKIGDIVACTVKETLPNNPIPKGKVVYAVVVRSRKGIKRKNGETLRFNENAVVLVKKEKKEYKPSGTRVFGPIPKELRDMGFMKIISLAPEVI